MTVYNLYCAYEDGDSYPVFEHLGTFLTKEALEAAHRLESNPRGRWAQHVDDALLYASRDSQVDGGSLLRKGFLAETVEIT